MGKARSKEIMEKVTASYFYNHTKELLEGSTPICININGERDIDAVVFALTAHVLEAERKGTRRGVFTLSFLTSNET